MYYDAPFYYAVERSGKKGICAEGRQKTPMIVYRESPYASARTNHWLARRMLRLYKAYYKRVMRESEGKFWEEFIGAPMSGGLYTTFCGGEANDGDQVKEHTKR